MPPPYAFAPLEMLAGKFSADIIELDVDDDAVQLINVLLETVKMLLLTVVRRVNRLFSVL